VNVRLVGDSDSAQGGMVSVTVNVCGLPGTVPPVASVAESVTCVVYVPGNKLVATSTPILPDWPAPVSVPLEVSLSQGEAGTTLVFHDTGQRQLPHPVKVTVCGVGVDEPASALNDRKLDEGGAIEQGGCTNRVIVMVCGLPGAGLPLVSDPLRVTCPT